MEGPAPFLVRDRFQEWREAGAFERIWVESLRRFDKTLVASYGYTAHIRSRHQESDARRRIPDYRVRR